MTRTATPNARELAAALRNDPALAAAASDHAEARASADVFDAAPAALRERLGLERRRFGQALALIAPGLSTPMFNRVIGLGMPPDPADGHAGAKAEPATHKVVEALRAAYRERGVTNWWLHWNPHALPRAFDQALTARGWSTPARLCWAKMLHDEALAPVRASMAFEIEATSPADAGATGAVIAAAFEMPPFMGTWLAALQGRAHWRMYTLRDAGAVVGGACLFLAPPAAWLGMGGVLPSHRGRGGQPALIARRIADARAAGAVVIATETGEPIAGESNPSLDNLRDVGFRTVASRLNLTPPPGE